MGCEERVLVSLAEEFSTWEVVLKKGRSTTVTVCHWPLSTRAPTLCRCGPHFNFGYA